MDVWYFQYIVDAMVLIFIAFCIMVYVLYKRNQYQKQADKCIKAVLRYPTGRDLFYVREFDQDAEWIEVEGGNYKLNPEQRRWSKHPARPFLGLKWLQADIRTEVWDFGNPNPVSAPQGDGTELRPVVTAQEVYAYANNIQATRLISLIQEQKDRQEQIIKVFENQPNKWVVYGIAGFGALGAWIAAVLLIQIAGVV